MSLLKVFAADSSAPLQQLDAHDAIANVLQSIGVRFERWQASTPLSVESTQEQVLAAYQAEVDGLMNEYAFQSADVIALRPDHPDRAAFRAKFLDEHTHSDFEVRFFVDGKGLFYIHHEDKVYGVLCEAGDLISVPADVKHWFDMGEAPSFKCIRLFTTQEGWVANYTGDGIATSFPTFEQFQS
jgi:1,2-dihydroxy-3-keto-5-methylthiopentene dioxygenase